jgi:SNF2 Helicase protein/SNF2-related domain
VPLVRIRGQWVELDDRHLKAALKFLEAGPSGTMTAAEVLGVALGTDAPPGDLPLAEVAADGWLGDLLSGQADERLTPAGTPAGFHGTLRPYQQRGLSWLSFLGGLGIGAVLADDMGLGKTVQILALLSSGGTTPRTPRCAPDGSAIVSGARFSPGGALSPSLPRRLASSASSALVRASPRSVTAWTASAGRRAARSRRRAPARQCLPRPFRPRRRRLPPRLPLRTSRG